MNTSSLVVRTPAMQRSQVWQTVQTCQGREDGLAGVAYSLCSMIHATKFNDDITKIMKFDDDITNNDKIIGYMRAVEQKHECH